jgi:EmrB/QacA subfamily drug resistance transporter
MKSVNGEVLDDALVRGAPARQVISASGLPDRRRWVFAAALSTIFMAAMEGTIVATAMPAIVGALGSLDLFSWVFSAYLLSQAMMIPIYGRLADMYGRKPVLLIGIGLFLAGSVLCGFASDIPSLIAFRALQGVGAGSLIPIAQTVVGDIYNGEERARMQGYVSSTFGSAAILGPILGSLLVTHFHWSLIFWINVPLGLVAALMLQWNLIEDLVRRRHRIDLLGSVLMALTTALLMFAAIRASVLNAETILLLIALAACLLGALLWQERRAIEPMLPLKLFRNRIIAGGNIVGLANGMNMMSIVGFLPAYMQGVMSTGTGIAAAALAAMSVAWSLGGLIGSRMMLAGSYRRAALGGAMVLLCGSLMMVALTPNSHISWPITGALLMGFGMGVTNICFVVAIQAHVDRTQRGLATSSVSFNRIMGQAFGGAVFGGVLNIVLATHALGSSEIIVQIMHPGTHQAVDAAARSALASAVHNIYLIGVLLTAVVAAAVLLLPSGLQLLQEKVNR